jgi:hypothetical protein
LASKSWSSSPDSVISVIPQEVLDTLAELAARAEAVAAAAEEKAA